MGSSKRPHIQQSAFSNPRERRGDERRERGWEKRKKRGEADISSSEQL